MLRFGNIDAAPPLCKTPAMRYSGRWSMQTPQNAPTQQGLLPGSALANLGLGFLSDAGTAHLFAFRDGFSWANSAWLMAVLIGTGIAGLYGQMPGVEPRPYILRFDRGQAQSSLSQKSATRRVNAVLNLRLLSLAGLLIASITGIWYIETAYQYAYFLSALSFCCSRVRQTTALSGARQGRGTGTPILYGSVWAVTIGRRCFWFFGRRLPIRGPVALSSSLSMQAL